MLRAVNLFKILIVTCLLFSPTTFAGTITGTVIWVIARASDGLTYVQLNGTASGQPSCAKGTYFIVRDETSDIGHKQYAMLLLAQATGARLTIWGTGFCTRWADGEDIDGIQILSQ